MGQGAGAVSSCGRHADAPQGFHRVLRFRFFERGHISPVNPFGNRMGGWVRPANPAPSSRGATVFGSQRAGSRGVFRSQPLIPRGFVRNWVRQRAYKSVKVGGLQGAMAGAVPGAAIGLYSWFSGDVLAWPLLISLAGTAGGLLRGWKPGHRLAALIDRYIGWKLFWEGIGLVAGITIGGMIGMIFVWAIFPVILGFVLGARTGIYLGRKIWQLGQNFGWERIWGAISGLGFGALGFGLAQLLGIIGMNTLGANLSMGLLPFAANDSLWWALLWMLSGAAGGALSGALAGILADLLGRLTGLVD